MTDSEEQIGHTGGNNRTANMKEAQIRRYT